LPNGKTHKYRKKDVIEWCKTHDASKIRPIFEWTAQQTIDYIRNNGQLPNFLYFQGFSRVGCFPCIMSRHREIKLIIENHPEQWEKLKQHEKEVGSTFFPPDYIPKHAQKNGIYATAEDVELYFKRKNATLDMFELETPSCMSMYGLCE
jgi:3'-phosphoadenosine 5'-phosphosulfate sulfotransferase (PAPS reductase)/FAD synthetase